MKTTKFFKVIAVLSPLMVASVFSVSAMAQDSADSVTSAKVEIVDSSESASLAAPVSRQDFAALRESIIDGTRTHNELTQEQARIRDQQIAEEEEQLLEQITASSKKEARRITEELVTDPKFSDTTTTEFNLTEIQFEDGAESDNTRSPSVESEPITIPELPRDIAAEVNDEKNYSPVLTAADEIALPHSPVKLNEDKILDLMAAQADSDVDKVNSLTITEVAEKIVAENAQDVAPVEIVIDENDQGTSIESRVQILETQVATASKDIDEIDEELADVDEELTAVDDELSEIAQKDNTEVVEGENKEDATEVVSEENKEDATEVVEAEKSLEEKVNSVYIESEDLFYQASGLTSRSEDEVIAELKEAIKNAQQVAEELATKVTSKNDVSLSDELEDTNLYLEDALIALDKAIDNKEVRSKSYQLQSIVCAQKNQINDLTNQMAVFQESIMGPINNNMEMMMQLMMMNMMASQGPNMGFQFPSVDPGYTGQAVPGQDFGAAYGMKMLSLNDLFNARSMGGVNYNVYNVGGNYYGGDYNSQQSAPAANPMHSIFDPRMMYNPTLGMNLNAPYAHNFLNSSLNTQSRFSMDAQNNSMMMQQRLPSNNPANAVPLIYQQQYMPDPYQMGPPAPQQMEPPTPMQRFI